MLTLSPDETTILTALRTFIVGVVGNLTVDGVDVIKGQDNQVGEPSDKDFIVMWPLNRPRLSTNIDDYVDTAFIGSIAGTVLTVTEVTLGALVLGATVFAVDIAANTILGAPISVNPDGTGTYNIAPSQTLSSTGMASGELNIEQKTEIIIQLDIHSSDLARAGNMAQIISTTFRDAYAVGVISAVDPNITPLFSDDPRQTPFIDGEQQYETRWTVDVHLQADQTVSGIPQQFAASIAVTTVSVDAAYPP